MTRLTIALKEKIIEAAFEKSGVTKRLADIDVKRKAWAEDVRIKALGGKKKADEYEALHQQVKSMLEALPKSMQSDGHYNGIVVRRDDDILLNVAGMRFRANFGEYRVTPKEYTLLADDKLAIRFSELEAEEHAACDQKQTVRTTVCAALEKVSTIKALLKIWPEVVELLPAGYDTDPAKAQLPAIRTEDLNAMIGLPSDKKTKKRGK